MFIELIIRAIVVLLISSSDLIAFRYGRKWQGKGLSRHISMSASKSVTEQIFNRVAEGDSSAGAGGSSSFQGLMALDRAWDQLRHEGWKKPIPQIVFCRDEDSFPQNEANHYDIAVIGGTLGVFYALSLQRMGYRVAIIERALIKGRSQEWNISRKELQTLARLGLMSETELQQIMSIEFNPVRVGFHTDTSQPNNNEEEGESVRGNGFEMNVTDILNLGIKPDRLIDMVKNKFIEGGGAVFERSILQNITTYNNLALINYQDASSSSNNNNNNNNNSNNNNIPTTNRITARLVIDAMGNGSPVVRQIRGNVEPDGVCIVVGSCARGFEATNNTYSDVIYTDTPITAKKESSSSLSQLQYFWEAFPAGSGSTDRTTYLFTYLDAKPERPSVLSIFDDYWELLPRYQGKKIDDLQFLRVLFGLFPTYRDSPVQTPFSRIIQVGDASGIQSPLSFGGFGSLTRHLERITLALDQAMKLDLLSAKDINCINSYQPNLSTCWMFQRAMSVRIGYQPSSSDAITITLSNSFASMKQLGEETYRPFLQDVLQFVPLLKTLSLAFVKDPMTPVRILPHVGLVAMLDFFQHFFFLGLYTLIVRLSGKGLESLTSSDKSILNDKQKFYVKRFSEALKYGSGLDYYDHEG